MLLRICKEEIFLEKLYQEMNVQEQVNSQVSFKYN